jgi:hypothetical protein
MRPRFGTTESGCKCVEWIHLAQDTVYGPGYCYHGIENSNQTQGGYFTTYCSSKNILMILFCVKSPCWLVVIRQCFGEAKCRSKHFSPEDGGSKLLRNVGLYQPIHAAIQLKRTLSELSSPWKSWALQLWTSHEQPTVTQVLRGERYYSNFYLLRGPLQVSFISFPQVKYTIIPRNLHKCSFNKRAMLHFTSEPKHFLNTAFAILNISVAAMFNYFRCRRTKTNLSVMHSVQKIMFRVFT